MLVRAYRTHQPTLLLGLLVLVPALWSGGVMERSPAEPGQQMLFYQPFARLFATVPWSAALIGALVTMGLAVQVDALANDRELFERRNHLAALLFPILLAIGPGTWPRTRHCSACPWYCSRCAERGEHRDGPELLAISSMQGRLWVWRRCSMRRIASS
ncbi:MAG: hypothetical protein IPI07_02550 [Flavobacteriales bacterium]|nr:hypothetical protein [Flavobacteriales bacterium]